MWSERRRSSAMMADPLATIERSVCPAMLERKSVIVPQLMSSLLLLLLEPQIAGRPRLLLTPSAKSTGGGGRSYRVALWMSGETITAPLGGEKGEKEGVEGWREEDLGGRRRRKEGGGREEGGGGRKREE
mmetsp:Transcript_4426/g.10403  ORF Transcript_4426/g.10403 Transcript_4426/m.10403 type:complete len:130 (+) Transcript_4426:3435-3824(+)